MEIIYVGLFLTLLKTCSTAMVTPHTWTNNDNTTEKVVFFPNLDKIMVERGERIAKELTKPSDGFTEYSGRELIEDLFRYNVCVEDAIEFMLSEDEQEKEAGMRVYNAILKAEGPQHLRVTPDLELVRKKFKDIKDEDVKSIGPSIAELRSLWAKWQEEVSKLKA